MRGVYFDPVKLGTCNEGGFLSPEKFVELFMH